MISRPLKLMCVLAHPDDESMAMGGMLAKYAAAGVQTYLVMATRGERGWFGPANENPGHHALGLLREGELMAAARHLGLHEVSFLDYTDGELDCVHHATAVAKIVAQLRRVRPDVVVTFDPNGMYGHPDHVAISQLTTTAVMAAADPSYAGPGAANHTGHGTPHRTPHRVAKLYYRAYLQGEQDRYESIFGRLVMPVDSVDRRFTTWPEWAITTKIDVGAYRRQAWQAILCHRSQLPATLTRQGVLDGLYADLAETQTYYRAMSMVNGGRDVEHDLFAGVRCQFAPRQMTYPMQPVAAYA